MARKRLMVGWIKRRARQIMRSFNTPRAKAVRYAADDWEAMQGGARSCDLLGVCQREAVRVFKGADQDACTDPGRCVFRTPIVDSTPAMQGFHRFLAQCKGPAR